MPLLTATISGQLLRPDLTAGNQRVTVTAVTDGNRLAYPGVVIDEGVAVEIDNSGYATVTLPQIPQTSLTPVGALWRLRFQSGHTDAHWDFTLTANTTWDAIVNVANVPVTSSIQAAAEAARDAAIAAAASVAVSTWQANTAVVANQVVKAPSPDGSEISANSSRTTRASFDATEQTFWTPVVTKAGAMSKTSLDGVYAAKSRTGTRAVGTGELTLNVADYGVVPDTTVQSLTSLNAAITSAAALGSVTVYWPPPTVASSYYNLATSLPQVSGVTYRGDGPSTLLAWSSGSMLTLTGLTTTLTFDGLGLTGRSGAGHLIDMTNSVSGLIYSTFRNVIMTAEDTTKSLLFYRGGATGNLFGLGWDNCQLIRQTGHTVSAFDIVTSGAGCNTWRFIGGLWHSHSNTAGGPFFRAESTGGSFIGAMTFLNVVGEQNLSGMIHIYSPNGVTVDNVQDHDAAANYTDDLFKFDLTTGGAPRNVHVDRSGTSGGATFNSGKFHLNVAAGVNNRIGAVINGSQPGLIGGGISGRTIHHSGAIAGSVRTITSSRTLDFTDWLVVVNSAIARVVTLPDLTSTAGGTYPPGREYVIKNIGSASATVSPSGTQTIDGSTSSLTLATNVVQRLITDGTNWFKA